MKVDFNKLKTEISLPDLFLHFGWSFAPGTSNAAVKMTNGTDVYIIKKINKGIKPIGICMVLIKEKLA